jgi:DNA-directed RNA polymerase subunit RPC12/RpoP
MELDPHTLNQIIQRIAAQVRCPQCGGKVPVEIPSVRITGDDFLLLELKCADCQAYIVLHACLQGAANLKATLETPSGVNASSALSVSEDDIKHLRAAIEQSGGSFKSFFSQKKA